jgi:hypothetical protein
MITCRPKAWTPWSCWPKWCTKWRPRGKQISATMKQINAVMKNGCYLKHMNIVKRPTNVRQNYRPCEMNCPLE